ncbi:unnamed protein product, partial [Mesorhabditis spiculigera]
MATPDKQQEFNEPPPPYPGPGPAHVYPSVPAVNQMPVYKPQLQNIQQPIPTHVSIPVVTVGHVDYGPYERLINCPFCKEEIMTSVDYKLGRFALVVFCAILFLSLFMFFAVCFLWVPFCIKFFKDADHSCPKCKAHLGTYQRI